ncbi:hypothetical protein SAMN00777080_1971 [Aquiflexum balticum DSM 16537]|uniref:Uncharacterized protein n=1 Tax=Aquiflexum balticum DSM 16537 TaxID=758820 RepID=A0A1W2H3D6_9BACT|nr:hypothetical protein [Aquiflexum balticum]SMD43379.1 hypothetical protein SAMN00777080_1971 [Aquiflexum balticum DSM 16537]
MKSGITNLGYVLGIFSSIMMLGCHDELKGEFPHQSEQEVMRIEGGTLKFASILDYESFFDDPEVFDIPDFQSLAKIFSKRQTINTVYGRLSDVGKEFLEDFEDATILQLLDKDGMIVIGEYLIYLDFELRVAAVTKDHSLRQHLIDRNQENPAIRIFDFEEDLLRELEPEPMISIEDKTGEESSYSQRIQSCPGSFPPGSGYVTPLVPVLRADCGNPDRKCDYTTSPPYQEGDFQYRAIATHVYQAAAIYFRLKSELVHQKRNTAGTNIWGSEGDPNMTITYWGNFKPNNKPVVSLSSCYASCQGCSPPPTNTEKIQKIHWEASRRLTQINLYGIYEGHLGGSHAQSGQPYYFQLQPVIR